VKKKRSKRLRKGEEGEGREERASKLSGFILQKNHKVRGGKKKKKVREKEPDASKKKRGRERGKAIKQIRSICDDLLSHVNGFKKAISVLERGGVWSLEKEKGGDGKDFELIQKTIAGNKTSHSSRSVAEKATEFQKEGRKCLQKRGGPRMADCRC